MPSGSTADMRHLHTSKDQLILEGRQSSEHEHVPSIAEGVKIATGLSQAERAGELRFCSLLSICMLGIPE